MRYYNFREGDRSEYLANYLLSGLGLVTPVPRQEDIGVDFYCQLADQESKHLSFGFPFVVQVKSDSVTSIVYGSKSAKKWKVGDIDWINRLELPLLFGIVKKQEMQIDIYNCSAFRHCQIINPNPTVIEFKPRLQYDENEVHYPSFELIPNWPIKNKGDGKKHIVDLGNPIVTIVNDDIYNKELLVKKKNLLREVIIMEQQNNVFRKLRLPHYLWAKLILSNERIEQAWFHMSVTNEGNIKNLFQALGPGLISLAINLKANNKDYLIPSVALMLKELPAEMIPIEIRENYPELFES